MAIKDNFNCDFKNLDFVEIIESFKILTEYSVFLIEKKHFEEIFGFYNYLFEKNFPESGSNLDDIDYGKLFIGKYANETIDIYKSLLGLWIDLQDKYFLTEKNILKLKFVKKKIDRLLLEYK